MVHRFSALVCIGLALGGCSRPKLFNRLSHEDASLEIDVPIPPFAHEIVITNVDPQSKLYRVKFSVPKNNSSAFFYEQACCAAGWQCEWLSSQIEPWIGIFYKPGRICVVEQRKEEVFLYTGLRANQDRPHHQRRR